MVFIVVMLVFMGFAVAITYRPANIIALSISIYAFEQWAQANASFFGAHASFINLGLGALCVYAIAIVALQGRNPLNPITSAMWVWCALFGLAMVSCLWSLDRNLSIFLMKYNIPYVATFVILVPLVIQTRDDMKKALTATLMFGSIVMVLLLAGTHLHAWGRTIEVDLGGGVVDRVGQLRTRLAPLAVAELAGHLLIISVLMNFQGIGKIWKYLRWCIVVLALTLIYRSGSRGQLIASLLSILMFITFSRGTRRAAGWIAAGVSTFLILGIATWSFVGYAGDSGRWDIGKMQTIFASTRLEYCSTLLDYWGASSPFNWLFGLGSSASYDTRILGRYCHVTVVEVLAELGFVGFVLLVSFTLLVSRDAIRLYNLTKQSDVDRGIAVTLTALFVFGVILSFKQGSFLSNTAVFSMGMMISRHAAVTQMAYQRDHVRDVQRRWSTYYAQFGGSHGQPPTAQIQG